MPSKAYQEFDETLQMVDALLAIEAFYPNPLPSSNQKDVGGLRGGSAVLMVAAFESFIKSLLEEYLTEVTYSPLKFDLTKIPDSMRLRNIEQIWYKAAKSGKEKDKNTKIKALMVASQSINSGKLDVESFSIITRGKVGGRHPQS